MLKTQKMLKIFKTLKIIIIIIMNKYPYKRNNNNLIQLNQELRNL